MSGDEWISSSVPYVKPRAADGGGDAWGREAAGRGRRGTQRVVSAGEVPAPAEVAGLLEVGEGDAVVVRRRIMYLDEEPTELTDTYYPARIAAGTRLSGTAKIPGGAVTLLAELGHTGRRVREDVVARMPSEEERELLRMERGEPVLRLSRLVLDAEDRPIQADMMTMPAQRQRLRYELRIG